MSVQGVLLRRTKYTTLDGKPILNLPTCRQTQESIALDAPERAFYDDLKRQSEAVVSGLREGASGCALPRAAPAFCALSVSACRAAHELISTRRDAAFSRRGTYPNP